MNGKTPNDFNGSSVRPEASRRMNRVLQRNLYASLTLVAVPHVVRVARKVPFGASDRNYDPRKVWGEGNYEVPSRREEKDSQDIEVRSRKAGPAALHESIRT